MASLGTLLLFLQCQAIFIFSGFFAAWHWAAWRRRVGLRRIERRGTTRTPYCVDFDRSTTGDEPGIDFGTRSRTSRHPKVAVVCPVKRFGDETARNWRTQMTSEYGGDLEYVFVAERESDEAVRGFAALVRDMREEGELDVEETEAKRSARSEATDVGSTRARRVATATKTRRGRGRRSARMLVAGSSATCSQKIHSMLAGALASDAANEFVLFLDDDVRAHKNTVGVLVASMTNDAKGKKPFLTNGFPLDVPPSRDAPFACYLVMVYHLVLLIAFSQGEWTKNVWGGCMMLRRASLASDVHGCASAYRDGGYSDDLILAALCDERGETVGCPFEAVFPQRLDASLTIPRWWNYLRRQLFVMDTYANDWNRRVNHGMLFVLSYLSLATTVALAACCADVAAYFARVFFVSSAFSSAFSTHDDEIQTAYAFFPAASAVTFACFALALRAARRMYRDTGRLIAALGDADAFEKVKEIRWRRVALAFVVAYALVPAVAAATLAAPGVEWAGVRYRKRNGKVTRVSR